MSRSRCDPTGFNGSLLTDWRKLIAPMELRRNSIIQRYKIVPLHGMIVSDPCGYLSRRTRSNASRETSRRASTVKFFARREAESPISVRAAKSFFPNRVWIFYRQACSRHARSPLPTGPTGKAETSGADGRVAAGIDNTEYTPATAIVCRRCCATFG